MLQKKTTIIYSGSALLSLVVLVLLYVGLPISQAGLHQLVLTQLEKIHRETIEQLEKESLEKKDLSFSHPVFLYQSDSLVFWSRSNITPPAPELVRSDRLFVQLQGDVQWIGQSFTYNKYRVVILLPVIEHATFLLHEQPGLFRNRIGSRLLNLDSIQLDLTSVHYVQLTAFHWLIYFLCLLIGTFSLMRLTHLIWSSRKEHKDVDKTTIFLFWFFLLSLPSGLTSLFDMHWMTRPLSSHLTVGTNYLAIISIFSGILFFSASKAKIYFPFDTKGGKKWLFYLGTMGVYGLTAILGLLTLRLIEIVFFASDLDLQLERLYSLRSKEIGYLILFLVIFSAFFSLTQLFFRTLHSSGVNWKEKLAGIAGGIALLLVSHFAGLTITSIYPLLLSYIILVIALDLYHDKKKLNSSWIFSWMILISAFLSMILFQIDFSRDQERRISHLKSLAQPRDHGFEALVSNGFAEQTTPGYLIDTIRIDSIAAYEIKSGLLQAGESLYFSILTGEYLLFIQNQAFEKLKLIRFIPFESPKKSNPSSTRSIHFAIYQNDSLLIDRLGGRSLWVPTIMDQPDESGQMFIRDNWYIIKLKSHSGITIVGTEPYPGILRPLSLFSLLFFLLSISLFCLSVINPFIHIIPGRMDLRLFEKNSLRSRIQISIISLIIVSFFIIGLVSNYYLQNLGRETNRIVQLDEAEVLRQGISFQLAQEMKQDKLDGIRSALLTARLRGEKATYLFGPSGAILSEPQWSIPQSQTNNYRLIPYSEFIHLKQANETKIYKYDGPDRQGVFFSITGADFPRHFSWIPAWEDQLSSGRISDILASFLSIYTLLFILSGAIAIALSNSITKPIEILGDKLKGLKLSRKNETLEWKNEDEIGSLIAIYNEMIHQLSDNARVMAKIERDTAWKEMAKQVAHEIKNPLTPLKLNIQYLESKVRSNPEDAGRLISQITPSLIEQIDNLSQIASEFSNFAQLPSANNEKVRLNEIVKKVHDFFRKREDLDFQLFVPINDILVFADKNHLVRILNNVVKNAIQSIPPEREGQITIRLFTQESNAIIQVSDNGTGIPEEMRDKVFSPNFTTKSSGTGLGLAISTNMLEAFNGRIYFETEVDQGTDFYIEIPLMRLEDNYPTGERVFLDD